MKAVFDTQQEVRTKRDVANKLRESTFPDGLLSGTESGIWGVMWEAARKFSEDRAYPNRTFPVTKENAHCVLCQQELERDAVNRLEQFETFVISTAEREFRATKDKSSRIYKVLDEMKVADEVTKETVKEIRIELESLANTVSTSLTAAEARRKAVIDGLERKQGMPTDLLEFKATGDRIETFAQQLEQRVEGLQKNISENEKEKIEDELKELRARAKLGKNEQAVLDEIERKKKIAAYGLCLDDTKTHGITIKSTAVTKEVVTQKLKKSFQEELVNLNFKHVGVELKEVGGDLGNLYHKLVLTRAPGVEVPKVVSEGEARCLSIAAFFAELSTADNPSTILFDDPVSSFDYKWRCRVAQRIVEASICGKAKSFNGRPACQAIKDWRGCVRRRTALGCTTDKKEARVPEKDLAGENVHNVQCAHFFDKRG